METNFRAAISSALKLQHAPALAPIKADSTGLPRFDFPRLDTLAGASPTWAETIDSLRAPRKPEERYWDWRKNAQVRPVVFNDSGLLDDSVVHLHLEHRIIQRLLGRFTAQGFTAHDLSRACFSQTDDNIPRVVLLGRLALFGPNAARLHEEVVSVTARWIDPEIRKAPLESYSREAEHKTLEILEKSLAQELKTAPDKVVLNRLKRSTEQDVQALLAHLTDRANAAIADAKKGLRKRAEQESADMVQILEDQRKRLTATAKEYDNPQLGFDFSADERKQLEANKKHWTKRQDALEKELADEPKRILANYAVKATRIEPVGIIYLWPRTG